MTVVWRRPAVVFLTPCPACWSRRAEAVTADLVHCLGRVWNEDLGRFARCQVTHYR